MARLWQASWDGGCLGSLCSGTLPAKDLVPACQNRAREKAGAWGCGLEDPLPPLLWATPRSPCLPVKGVSDSW